MISDATSPSTTPPTNPLDDKDNLAAELRAATHEAHTQAEHTAFAIRVLGAQVNREDYLRYIVALYHVYVALEAALSENRNSRCVSRVYYPKELSRKDALFEDIVFFTGSSDGARAAMSRTPPPAVSRYVEVIKTLGRSDPSRLVAHSYTRYLGDLSGGQILAKRIKKAFDLSSSEDGVTPGTSFYAFPHIESPRAFKDLYRKQLASITDREDRDAIVAEAIDAFNLNIALFNDLEKLSTAAYPALEKTTKTGHETISGTPKMSHLTVVALATSLTLIGAYVSRSIRDYLQV